MDENPKTIMTGFAPLDFLVAMVSPSITESIIASWDSPVYELVEKSKDKGIRGINDFLQTSGGMDERYLFSLTKVTQEIFDKLFKGQYKTLKELRDDQAKTRVITDPYTYQSNLNYTLFHYEKEQQDREEKIILIDSIFVNQ
ncbi:hypothetical protein ACHRV6_17390 [Flavobacterium sp. FlaQc-51]|uniref:hypothetical protein n=1 Tax=Flavobacterium sp. FlaQc-51 TaxID=3374184 RepID=UPI0037573FE4